jgi:hypothetical protein
VTERCAELERFVRGEVDPGMFSHEQHVRMGFELLRRHDFAARNPDLLWKFPLSRWYSSERLASDIARLLALGRIGGLEGLEFL